MSHALIGEIAGLLAVAQAIPYLVSILHGHTKPERTTYLIWFIVDTVTITSYITVGARTTIWTGIVYSFTGLLFFLLSIKYGIGGFSKFDVMCFCLAMLGVALWITTDNAVLALFYNIVVAKIGYLPTIKKAYFFPETENTASWVMTALTGIFNIFAITALTPTIAIPPISGAIMPAIVAALLLYPEAQARFRHHRRLYKFHNFLNHPIFIK